MSQIDEATVKKMAFLARLGVSEGEVARYTVELGSILRLVEEMNQTNVQNILPMAHPLDVTQRQRDDEVTETDKSEKFQSIAPQVESGLYLVPKVIE